MISVIMLAYNREQYIKNMIEDILNQTYKNFEFIIVDNGSMDHSAEIADHYAAQDQRISVIRLESPKSIGYARNLGLRKSRGEYVAYVDDDDRVKPDFLEFLFNLIEENDADMAMCGAAQGDGKSKEPQCLFEEKKILTGEEALRLFLERKYIRANTPTKLYKREILEKFPFEEKYRNEDIHTQYKYLLSAKKVAIHGLDKYYFTLHDSNVSAFVSDAGRWNAQTMKDYLEAFHNRTEYIEQNAPDTYAIALYSEWSFMISMIEKIDKFNLTDCAEIGRELIQILKRHKEQFINMPETKDFEKEWIERYLE